MFRNSLSLTNGSFACFAIAIKCLKHKEKMSLGTIEIFHRTPESKLYKLISAQSIRKTCLCNTYPLIPHFYIAKLGVCRGIQIFLIFAQNIDCGYSLELPQRGDSNVYTQSMF